MAIEVDGGEHLGENTLAYDKKRDKFLNSLGLKVLRFTNVDVLTNIEGVIESILLNLP